MIIVATPDRVAVLPAAVAAERRAMLPSFFLFVAPLALPAERDVIDLVAIADPKTPWPRQMRHTAAPTVCLIGDDPGTPGGMGGPDAWRCARKLGAWARAVIVHGAGGEAAHYQAAVDAALLVNRVVFIETTSAHAKAWAERIGCPRTLLILPESGPHPVITGEMVH
jgi:hypothetical protein